jgi:peptidoglycan/xylan/chitin deacetylase (PgdA/CDA1 family)
LNRLGEVVRRSLDRARGAAPIVWSRPHVGEPLVALTFDDGPSEWTEPLLDLLEQHGAAATFFVLGASIAGRERTLRRVVAAGHELGTHTQGHLDLAEVTDVVLADEIRAGARAIGAVVGDEPRLVRPPYGAVPRRVARLAGRMSFGPVVMWSVDPMDWNQQSPEPIVEHVLERLQPGAIVDLHDGIPPDNNGVPTRQATVDAVARLLPVLRERGYRLVTISELLEAS